MNHRPNDVASWNIVPGAEGIPDFFQQNVSCIVDDVVSQIQASLEIWPTLVEVCYYYKDKKPLPQTRVKNKRLETHRG